MAQKKPEYISLFVNIGLLLLCVLMLVIIPMLRYDINLHVGEESYLNLRISEHLRIYDNFSFGGRSSVYALGLPFILSYLPIFLVNMLPLIFGVFSFLLFWRLLNYYNINGRKWIMLLLAISPPFIYLFSSLNNCFVAIFLALFGLYMVEQKNKLAMSLGIFAFTVMPLFNFVISLIVAILLILFAFFKTKHKGHIFLTLGLMGGVAAIYYGYLGYLSGNSMNIGFSFEKLGINAKLMYLFSDLGGKFGIAIFSLVLFIFGLIKVWKNKYKDLFVFFSVVILLILVFFRSETIFLLNLFIVIFSVQGFYYLYNKDWANNLLKKFTIFILICGLLFSTLAFLKISVDEQPTAEIMDALKSLEIQRNGVVFTHPSRGILMNYVGKGNVMDNNYYFAPDVYGRWDDMQNLYYTRDINEALDIINKYNIKYIWVDDSFEKEIWGHDEDGLLFLLKYSPYFKTIYNQGGIRIWSVIGSGSN